MKALRHGSFVLLAAVLLLDVCSSDEICSLIQDAFAEVALPDRPCNCFVNGDPTATISRRGSAASRSAGRRLRDTGTSILRADNHWIGCTRQRLPTLFNALNALNETLISKLRVWDSDVSIVPVDLFNKVRPQTLIIENSNVGLFRVDKKTQENVFSPLATRLKTLELKGNIIKSVRPEIFSPLKRLVNFDLSMNRIQIIRKGDFEALTDLEVLRLNSNSIKKLEDGSFAQLKRLRRLNLADNSLTNITRNTFVGLENLEHLHLDGNQLTHVDWDAFSHMKQLQSLNLGSNHLQEISLRGLDKLERLYLNNNSFKKLTKLDLRDLPKLTLLLLDKNQVEQVGNDDFRSLSSSPQLATLSLASNLIKTFSTRAFEPLHRLETLSLQNNKITINEEVFAPLGRLINLFMSTNQVTMLDSRTLRGLISLEVLALDNNNIESIDPEAFQRTPKLKRLYLNNNRMPMLNPICFKPIEATLEIIDISENNWLCGCDAFRFAKWLRGEDRSHIEKFINLDKTNCFSYRILNHTLALDCKGAQASSGHSAWITVLGVALGMLSLLILATIVCLYLHDGRSTAVRSAANQIKRQVSPTKGPTPRSYGFRRVPSDMAKLIPNCPGSSSSNSVSTSTTTTTTAAPGVHSATALADSKKKVRFEVCS